MQECFICHDVFDSIKDLAKHIVENKDSHRKSLKFAASILTDVNRLNQKREIPEGRIALTEEEKESKREANRELSGIERVTLVNCPVCRQNYPTKIPVEYIQSGFAWRNPSGKLMVDCISCRTKFK